MELASSARSSVAVRLARDANVAVSPGVGFGHGGDGHVRFALIENEQRIRQATRAIKSFLALGARGSFGRAADSGRVLGEDTRRVARLGLLTTRHGGARARRSSTSEVEAALVDVEHDRVAVVDDPIGPPRNASGAMWPTINPCVAPEKRPSVISATVVAKAFADERCGDVQHLAHPRAAGRAFVADDDDVAGLDARAFTAAKHSSSESNTRAGPLW